MNPPSIGRSPRTRRQLLDATDLGVEEIVLAPAEEVRVHFHYHARHWLYLLEGSVRLQLGPTESTLASGEWVHVPPGENHGYRAAGPQPVRLLHVSTRPPTDGPGAGRCADFQSDQT